MSRIETVPEIQPAEGAPGDIADRINTLNAFVRDYPDSCLGALAMINGGDEIAGPLGCDAEYTARDLLQAYLDNRDELEAVFDDGTQDALSADGDYTAMLHELRDAKAIVYKTGVMGRKTEPNPAADRLRTRLSHYRLAFFVRRVATASSSSSVDSADVLAQSA